ncbi:hypothetical protein V9T40_014157 [Parthenolecanium corni]|uniref:Uncharacterized protein n=1 Tax=Parthenolecanium corni TaxID=536013 RepID=A0AAN9TG51_9HEMI
MDIDCVLDDFVYGKSILAPCSNELTDIGVNVMHHSTEAAQEAAMRFAQMKAGCGWWAARHMGSSAKRNEMSVKFEANNEQSRQRNVNESGSGSGSGVDVDVDNRSSIQHSAFSIQHSAFSFQQ